MFVKLFRSHRWQPAARDRIAGAIMAGFMLGGCALPAAAPTSRELVSQRNVSSVSYAVVNVDSHVANVLGQQRTSFGKLFKKPARYTPKNAFRAGDTVSVTIYETGGSTLFPPPNSGAAPVPVSLVTNASIATPPAGSASANTIPPQIIEADGTIAVPFAGRVKVAGLTPAQVGVLIEKELRHKAIAPQVVVTPVSNISNSVTVSGDVNAPQLVALSLRGERILDVITAAGGSKFPAYETYVHVVRDGQMGTMLLQTLIENPSENVIILPYDRIYLGRNPRTFVVLGATQRPAVFPFDRERITLAEAVAQGGGPIDSIGDLDGIYLFRQEPQWIASQMLGREELAAPDGARPEFVPVLYRIGLKDAEGYFLSQSIEMRDKDVLLIANAESVQLQKLLTLVRGFSGIAYDLQRHRL